MRHPPSQPLSLRCAGQRPLGGPALSPRHQVLVVASAASEESPDLVPALVVSSQGSLVPVFSSICGLLGARVPIVATSPGVPTVTLLQWSPWIRSRGRSPCCWWGLDMSVTLQGTRLCHRFPSSATFSPEVSSLVSLLIQSTSCVLRRSDPTRETPRSGHPVTHDNRFKACRPSGMNRVPTPRSWCLGLLLVWLTPALHSAGSLAHGGRGSLERRPGGGVCMPAVASFPRGSSSEAARSRPQTQMLLPAELLGF